MNRSPFELATSAFQHARQFQLRTNRLPPYPLVDDLVSETSRWLTTLRDEESHHARDLRIQVWRLRGAVLYGLVPFDDSALKICEIARSIVTKGKYYPVLRARCERLSERADALVSSPDNPKRDAVRAELARDATDGTSVGLIVALARNHLPAYTSNLMEEFQTLQPRIQFIASRRHLLASTFGHIVVPFGTRQCALTHEVLHGYRAPSATVVAYCCEAMAPQRNVRLPCPIAVSGNEEIREPHDRRWPVERDGDDTPVREDLWSSIKHAETSGMGGAAPIDTAYLVPARGLLLANGAHVFLRDDSKAVEISDLVDGRRTLDDYGKRFRRTPVGQLQTGDLIVLRVQGSGDYLVEVANRLMRKDGKVGLHDSALDWKPILRDVLTEHGSSWFLRQLEKRSLNLANHRYIWKWTTDEVISPQKESLFYEIIAILDDCDRPLGERDVLQAAKRRWEEMKELKQYHQKAGQRIRRKLLRRLRTIIDSRPNIGSEYELQIPGVSAGTMAIVRIAAVDTEVVSIPYHRAGVVSHTAVGGVV